MAIAFKNSLVQGVGTGFTDVYTCPPAIESAVVFGMTAANVDGTAAVTVEARIEDISNTSYTHIVAPDTNISIGSSLVVAGGIQKIVLEPGDKIQVACSVISGVDVACSVLEIS
jgi:hypothetical protein